MLIHKPVSHSRILNPSSGFTVVSVHVGYEAFILKSADAEKAFLLMSEIRNYEENVKKGQVCTYI